jgi:RND superfamily putative drug exporter
MSAALYSIGRHCVRFKFVVLPVWLAILIVTVLLANHFGRNTSNDLTLPGTGSTNAQNLLDAHLPKQANGTNPVVMEAPNGKLTSSANSKVVKDTVASLKKAPHVTKAVSPLSSQGSAYLSKDEKIGYIPVTIGLSQSDLTEEQAQTIIDHESPAVDANFQVANGGYLGNAVSKPDVESSELVGIIAAIIILIFMFGTLTAMSLPILTALVGVGTGLALIGLLGHGISVPTVGPTLGTMLGFDTDEAAARSVATAGGAVVFAGGTVVIALVSLAVAQIPLVSALGYSAAVVVLIAILTAITLIPALLAIMGKHIDSLRVPFLKPPPHDHRPHGWARWARFIGSHPIPAMLIAVAILLVLAIPVLNLQLGQQNNGQMPKSTTVRQAYDLIDKGFGPGTNGPLLIAVDFGKDKAHNDQKKLNQLKSEQQQQEQQAVQQTTQQLEAQGVPPDQASSEAEQQVSSQPPTKKEKQADQQEQFLKTTASDPRLVHLQNQIGKTKGVKDVSPSVVDNSGSAASFSVIPTTAPSADATTDLVNHLRDSVIPKADKGTTLTTYVGGQTASYIDLASRISDKLPLVIAVVIALSIILLLIAFRSVVVPLISALMNLLSVAAAYGVLTFVFQEGHGASLIGVDGGATPIVSYVPLMMFAILFGLSMDYQVFLMSRMREHFEQTGDNHEAVVDGLAVSARVITSAALIMVAVYTSFILNGQPVVKEFGLGLAAAIAIDATIVRCVLVPSVMVLLGKRNWWLPRWLSRMPRVGIEGEDYFKARDAAAASAAGGSSSSS